MLRKSEVGRIPTIQYFKAEKCVVHVQQEVGTSKQVSLEQHFPSVTWHCHPSQLKI